MYRPRSHYVGLICSDRTTDGVDDDYFRFQMINLLQVLNFTLPVVAMGVYFGLYVKICIYRTTNLTPANSTPSRGLSVTAFSVSPRLSIGIAQSGQATSNSHMRIVYQGLFMILLLAGEPLFNAVFNYVNRPVDNVAYQVAAYGFIYSTTPTNFLVFYVFNSQTRRFINTFIGEKLGWTSKGRQLLKTLSANIG